MHTLQAVIVRGILVAVVIVAAFVFLARAVTIPVREAAKARVYDNW
jgi:hypothetical protein